VVAACRAVADRPSTPIYADEAFLEAQQVGAWMELPLWVPRADEVFAYLDTRKAERAGLTTRPLVDTVRGVLAWCATRPTHERGAGLAPAREHELLARLAAAPESRAAGL
jgi:2'-hydroxyisoflavone reductase